MAQTISGPEIKGPPPTETPECEGSIAEAHQERPDGHLWEHPRIMLGAVVFLALLWVAFFAARIAAL
ncbi:hypothetical protein [Streptomyces tsukubensis]|uniref:Uncharacterized protein n=1 Tax=Streptomyces tsukubensis TaxID=83656 RepID=A0A1V4A8D2_9ACTN|nr:hypothetical protein [Streptomyces tsukubensis]OON78809.1 hypothetical protein B1H18_15695 [Streptomyces tsukubensis]QFR94286.1 hypothetical protein GBW32_16025 [Streptomyces tsukubensis]